MSTAGVDASRELCAAMSAAAQEDMIGTAWAPDALVLIESRLPWAANGRGDYGRGVYDALEQSWRRGLRTGALLIAPDPDYSTDGVRVIWHRKPEGAWRTYERADYVVPERHVAGLVDWLSGGSGEGRRYARYDATEDGVRDLLVCTHGAVDACCGKLGFPAYNTMREMADDVAGVRVWRTSHFGGHRFAPTVLDLPEGRYWGRLTEQAMRQLVRRDGRTAALHGHYRGWAGLADPYLAVAERELLARVGWAWTEYEVRGEIVELDEEASRAEVRIAYSAPFGADEGVYHASVVAGDSVEAGGCGLDVHDARQYKLVGLTRAMSHVAMTVAV